MNDTLQTLRVLCWACILAALAGCAAVPRPLTPPLAQDPPAGPPYEAWARVLDQHVDAQGRVNFTAVAVNRRDLDRFVAYVYDVAPATHPQFFPTRSHVLAYHINAYNALAMHKVIEAGIPATLAGLRKVSFCAFGKVTVGGTPITLYDYENKVIRPLGDPRIHVALNCMAVSCPRLPREPFLAQTLDQQLDREAWRFFNEERNVGVDSASKLVRLSEILDFYPDDFLLKSPSLIAYVNQYRDVQIPDDYAVRFFSYDWTINRQ